jgi:hypothetical protein
MTSEEQIEEILMEAHAHSLREEVMDRAKKLMQDNPKMDRVMAYSEAFHECIK